jgi:hypothetical protein
MSNELVLDDLITQRFEIGGEGMFNACAQELLRLGHRVEDTLADKVLVEPKSLD